MNSTDKRIEALKNDEQYLLNKGEKTDLIRIGIGVLVKQLDITVEQFKKYREFFERYKYVDISARRFEEEPAFENIEFLQIKRNIEALKQSGIKFEVNLLNKVEWEEKE